MFGEHQFVSVSDAGVPDGPVTAVDGKVVRVSLGPWAQTHLKLQMKRYANLPSYDFPPFD